MDFFTILTLIGGLSLFLYGMNEMGDGLKKLIFEVGERLRLLPPITVYESEVVNEEIEISDEADVTIRRENGKYIIYVKWN